MARVVKDRPELVLAVTTEVEGWQMLAAAILRIAGDAAYTDDLRRRGAIHAAAFTWEV